MPWGPLDLRSMRSMQSQSRSQQRLLHSQGVASQSRPSGVPVSGNREALPEDEVDVLAKMSVDQVLKVVLAPPQLDEDDHQSDLVLISPDRKPLAQGVQRTLGPNTVLLHVYNLNEQFVKTNELLAFSSDERALGGVFHVGVECYGSEWSYGVYGVCCDPPRSETAHVYQCSVLMPPTPLNQKQFADLLFEMCKRWRGCNYDIVSKNCCSFAREFCLLLGVGATPEWVDRFARMLHAGREAGREAMVVSAQAAQQAGQFAAYHGMQAGVRVHRAVTEDVPVLYEAAKPHVQAAATETARAVHKVATEDVPALVEAARPHVQTAAVTVGNHAVIVGNHAQRIAGQIPGHAERLSKQTQEAYEYARPHVQRVAQQTWQSVAGGFDIFAQNFAALPDYMRGEPGSPCSAYSEEDSSLLPLPTGSLSKSFTGSISSMSSTPVSISRPAQACASPFALNAQASPTVAASGHAQGGQVQVPFGSFRSPTAPAHPAVVRQSSVVGYAPNHYPAAGAGAGWSSGSFSARGAPVAPANFTGLRPPAGLMVNGLAGPAQGVPAAIGGMNRGLGGSVGVVACGQAPPGMVAWRPPVMR
eukprot:TRINITY_DN16799_c0_g1_i2.p1 TRINITY_DN16799_c0_g1~~TRINITY_DN16799_c0_g1_i2.p1  ORF type:complete len:616 (-),score=90.98 TRINITY_DN16799_c0_g1_i2:133-1893(-)